MIQTVICISQQSAHKLCMCWEQLHASLCVSSRSTPTLSLKVSCEPSCLSKCIRARKEVLIRWSGARGLFEMTCTTKGKMVVNGAP